MHENPSRKRKKERMMGNPSSRNSRMPKAESRDPPKYAALIRQLITLEKDWESFKNSSRPRNEAARSPRSGTCTSVLTYSDHFLREKHSPRVLMSRLQRGRSPPSHSCVVREILGDRRAALTSGRIKGRRLFEYDGEETAEAVANDHSEGVGVMCRFPEEKVVVVEEERAVGGCGRGPGGVRKGGCVVAMAWFVFVFILVSTGLIMMSCNGKFVGENLAPT